MKPKGRPGNNMVRTALFIKPAQAERLQILSDRTGAPMAELIRRAIDAYLEARKGEVNAK